jgi:hypothetical protein
MTKMENKSAGEYEQLRIILTTEKRTAPAPTIPPIDINAIIPPLNSMTIRPTQQTVDGSMSKR